MNLIPRKFYIEVAHDEWLEVQFGAQRERSRAVDLALRDFIAKIEENREKLTVEKLDLDLVSDGDVGTIGRV